MNTGLLDGLTANAGALADVLIPAGVIWEWAGDTLPDPALYGRWAWADGSAVSRAEYARLFKHTGVLHGAGNGTTTFNLPNRKGKTGVGYDVADSDFNAVGKTGGSKTSNATHTHTLNSHTHALATHDHGSNSHVHGMRNHYHGGGNHTHTVNAHSHGGGTGYHGHELLGQVGTGNTSHTHGGSYNQYAGSPSGGYFAGERTYTNSVGAGNSNESPGTGGAVSGSGDWVWAWEFGDGNVGGSGANVTGATSVGAAQGPSTPNTSGGSADAASGNLPPYIAMNYIIKV